MTRRIGNSNDNRKPSVEAGADALAEALARRLAREHHAALIKAKAEPSK